MSATERVRELLDERGTEHYDYRAEVWWGGESSGGGGAKYTAYEQTDGLICVEIADLTPGQVIAATLGRGNAGRYVGLRRGEYWERTENSDYYCGGCGWKVTDHDSYCPECGGALHEAALGSCNCTNDCTNSERTGTCHADETDRIECGGIIGGRHYDIHIMECSACGGTYEHVFGDYEYCPHCRRRIVEVDE